MGLSQQSQQRVGAYALGRALGQGGTGTVYEGCCDETGQRVAIKLLSSAQPAFVATIRREIQTLQRLRHPGIVQILDHGVEDGLPWYAMSLIDGVSLRQSIDAPPDEQFAMVESLCQSLAFLHGEGFVHRDLKPDNILIDQAQRPVLVDFGVATRFAGGFGEGGQQMREVLESGQLTAGTFVYMAPEQLRGEHADARADLYAFGCILYELFSGQPPFVGASAMAIARAHLREQPEPLSGDGSLSHELARVILQLLAKQPEQRPGSALDVLGCLPREQVRAALSWEDVPSPKPYLYRARFVGRRKLLEACLAAFSRHHATHHQLLLIGGESGIGKTRVAMELIQELKKRPVQVCTGAATHMQGVAEGAWEEEVSQRRPLGMLQDVFQVIVDAVRAGSAGLQQRCKDALDPYLTLWVPSLEAMLERPWAAEAPGAPEQVRQRIFDAISALLSAYGSKHPLVIFLDDLQWADEMTLAYLRAVTAQSCQPPRGVIVVGLFRSEVERASLQALRAMPDVTCHEVGRLAEDELQQLIGDMLTRHPPPPGLAPFLCHRSQGNPLFVAEYLRLAVEQKLLRRTATGWSIAGSDQLSYDVLSALPLPLSLQELLTQRLRGLPEDALALVDLLSCFGRRVSSALLQTAQACDDEALSGPLHALQAHAIVDIDEEERVVLAHQKIGEVRYAGLSPAKRSALHGRIAVAWESAIAALPVGQWPISPGELGWHWQEAGAIERAKAYLHAAAQQALSQCALREAKSLFQRYLRLFLRPCQASIRARNAYARHVLTVQSQLAEAAEEHQGALEDAVAAGLCLEQVQSLFFLAGLDMRRGQLAPSHQRCTTGLALLKELSEAPGEEPLFGDVDHTPKGCPPLEQLPLWEHLAPLAVPQCQPDVLQGDLYNLLGVNAFLSNDFEKAEGLYQDALRQYRSAAYPRGVGLSLVNIGNMHYNTFYQSASRDRSCLEKAKESFLESIGVLEALGDKELLGGALGNLASSYFQLGELEMASRYCSEALELFRVIQDHSNHAAYFAFQVSLRRLLGEDPGALEEALLESIAALARSGERLYELVGWAEYGHLLLAQGRSAAEPLATCVEGAEALGFSAEHNSDIGYALRGLQDAQDDFVQGLPLFHGQALRSLSPWLQERLKAG